MCIAFVVVFIPPLSIAGAIRWNLIRYFASMPAKRAEHRDENGQFSEL